MYYIEITDPNKETYIYTVGEEPKAFETLESVQIEILQMKEKERQLFGDVITNYRIKKE